MAYSIGQFNKFSSDGTDNSYITIITSGYADTRDTASPIDVGGSTLIFKNLCLRTSAFNSENHYYFHGRIKRMLSDQVFYVKLVQYSDNTQEQYIKTITVGGGDEDDWYDVEFIFTPYVNTFDTILFELVRSSEDYLVKPRYPVIIYEELGVINNLIGSKVQIGDGYFIKMGVQSKPGLMMCINGEEIRTSWTGVYELTTDEIIVDFFSVVHSAEDPTLETEMARINAAWSAASDKSTIKSVSLLNDGTKTRYIDDFTLDYMYKEG